MRVLIKKKYKYRVAEKKVTIKVKIVEFTKKSMPARHAINKISVIKIIQ
jgi:hypothetical protein